MSASLTLKPIKPFNSFKVTVPGQMENSYQNTEYYQRSVNQTNLQSPSNLYSFEFDKTYLRLSSGVIILFFLSSSATVPITKPIPISVSQLSYKSTPHQLNCSSVSFAYVTSSSYFIFRSCILLFVVVIIIIKLDLINVT